MTIKTILLAADLQPESRPAIDYAFTLGEKLGAVVHAAHALPVTVVPEAHHAGDAAEEARREQAQQQLVAAVAHHAASPSMGSCVISLGEPISVITELAASLSADAIVVGTHDRTGVHRWVVGSAAEGLLHETTLPVFVVKTRLKRSRPA